MARRGRSRGGDVLIEFYYLGNAVKVSAIDPVTLTEVSIVGAPDAGEEVLKRIAIRKLEYVMAKNKSARDDGTLV